MASTKRICLSKASRHNMKNYPATVERSTYAENVFLIYCSSNGHRSYLYTSLGFPLTFTSFDSAQHFINTFK